ncbi:MAG: Gfo/Idh/MocA family oxidoreductase [Planctomycetia bacterium]|nr:Gfo/Idh/MocA family oxidoreductase [Planctomycetia bacterium]
MVNIALVGAGGIGRTHAAALKEIPEANLVAVVDADKSVADAVAEEYETTACARLADCLDRVDVVYVLTPPSSHRELAVMAMEAGKHVFCEKPISITIEDAEAMVQSADKAGVKLMMAFNMRFRKGFKRLKEIVESACLGKTLNVWSQRLGMNLPRGYNWRTDPELLCGMSIESLSHDIDLIRWFAGDIVEVKAGILASNPELAGFDDNAAVVLQMSSGAVGMIHASWSSHVGMNSRGIIGTRGTAIVEGHDLWTLKTLRYRTAEMESEVVETIDDSLDEESYVAENRHFVGCVAGGLGPSVTGADGLAALRVSRAIHESHRSGKAVRLA